MQPAPTPADEADRLLELKSLKILDTPREERFDRITKMVTVFFGAPISTISFIDEYREWYKSCQGLDATEGKRAISFCGHAIAEPEILVIPDTLKDSRFADNPMVVGAPHIRFYAGAVVRGPGEKAVGVLCVKDTKPRDFSPQDRQMLIDLASWVELEINTAELAQVLTQRRSLFEELTKTRLFLNSIIENIPNMVFVKDANDLKFVLFNKAGEELIGISKQEMMGKSDYDFFPKEQADFFVKKDRETLAKGETVVIDEEPIETKRKGKRMLRTLKIPVHDPNGVTAYLLGISEDITDVKKSHETAAKRTVDLERMNNFMVNRELRMIELKKENTRLKEELEKLRSRQAS